MMRRAQPLLGTVGEVAAEGDSDSLPAAIEAAFAAIADVHRLMSFHDPDSDVSRVNGAEAGDTIHVDPRTFRVLEFAQEVSDASGGAFDITIAPSLIDTGFLPGRPGELIPRGARYRDLELLPGHQVRWRRRGWIDLGGIGKGYAADCAIAQLRSHGASNAIVNAGGDLRCFGQPQPIYVRHPAIPASLIDLGRLTDAALATSAGYFSGLAMDGCRVDPLVDPKQGRCTRWDASVSVAASEAMAADALTKVVRLSPDTAPDILDRFGAQAIVIDREGVRCCGRSLLQTDTRQ